MRRVCAQSDEVWQDGHSDFVTFNANSESTSKHKVDIRAPAWDFLTALSFNSAARHNRSALEIGSRVYACLERNLLRQGNCTTLEKFFRWRLSPALAFFPW